MTEIRELNAEASKMDAAACEAKEGIPRVGCLGIQNGCLGIGSAIKSEKFRDRKSVV